MTMTQLVVLANSWKHSDWCIAGIDLATGAWVRPVSSLDDGRIPKSTMKLDGYFPKLCDIIEIPLARTGESYGFEKENRTILPGNWIRHGTMKPSSLQTYVARTDCIFNTLENYISLEVLQKKTQEKQCSLQLIQVYDYRTRSTKRKTTGDSTWQGIFSLGNREWAIRITDPVFIGKLTAGYKPSSTCLLTISLSMPYKPPDWEAQKPPACWKLIAGVIEFPVM